MQGQKKIQKFEFWVKGVEVFGSGSSLPLKLSRLLEEIVCSDVDVTLYLFLKIRFTSFSLEYVSS